MAINRGIGIIERILGDLMGLSLEESILVFLRWMEGADPNRKVAIFTAWSGTWQGEAKLWFSSARARRLASLLSPCGQDQDFLRGRAAPPQPRLSGPNRDFSLTPSGTSF